MTPCPTRETINGLPMRGCFECANGNLALVCQTREVSVLACAITLRGTHAVQQ